MIRRIAAALLALLWLGAAAAYAGAPADLVLRGGAIYTVDAARTWAQAIAVRDGRIAFVGMDRDVAPFVGSHTRVVDLAGRMVLPGFVDSHVHPLQGGMELGRCNLSDCDTPEKLAAAIRVYAAAHPREKWIVGSGWALPTFPGGNPSRGALDVLVPDRPAYLEAADGHSAWVNSLALKIAGITRGTPDPPRGRIERDARGDPSGTLREAAVELVHDKVPEPTFAVRHAGLARALKIANGFGITAMQDADVDLGGLEAYASADLTARITAAMGLDLKRGEVQIDELVARRTRFTKGLLRATAVKIFADGVLETHTAAMLAPYADRPDDSGILNLDPPAFRKMVTRLDREGFQVHVHAIGDRAVRAALDAFETARAANGARDARHTIAHLQVIDPADVPRFRRLGVVANFQSFWMWADPYVVKLSDPALGAKRAAYQYPIADVRASGANVVGGSDWTVSSLNPLDAIQVALTHRDVEKPDGEAWLPSQIVDLPFLLAAYTIEGAWLNGLEKTTGSLEVGKSADLVVLERNLFEVPVGEIHRVKVVLTMLEGRAVFGEVGGWGK